LASFYNLKYNEEINAHYETFHTVTWSKTVTEAMVASRSKQSLVNIFILISIPISFICTIICHGLICFTYLFTFLVSVLIMFLIFQHFFKFISRRFLQNQCKMLLKCEETGFSYMCKIESSKQPDENGIFLKRIGEGWCKFKDQHNLRVGDNMRFEMSFYPYVLKVWIERRK
jgi:hypothetical protein